MSKTPSQNLDTIALNPFPGLRPYDSRDAHLFFGREDQIHDINGRLKIASKDYVTLYSTLARVAVAEKQQLNGESTLLQMRHSIERQAIQLAQSGRATEALDLLGQRQKFDPAFNIEASTWAGIARSGCHDRRNAKRYLGVIDLAVQLRPEDWQLHDTRGILLALLNRRKEAITAFKLVMHWSQLERVRKGRSALIKALESTKKIEMVLPRDKMDQILSYESK